jgi:hypothetical protein
MEDKYLKFNTLSTELIWKQSGKIYSVLIKFELSTSEYKANAQPLSCPNQKQFTEVSFTLYDISPPSPIALL